MAGDNSTDTSTSGGSSTDSAPAEGKTTAPPAEAKPTEKTLPQSEVDRIVKERVERERAKYGDYADLKTKAQRLAEIEDANASELERAVKKAREEGMAEVQSSANSRLIAAEARALAAEAHFRNPALAIKAIDTSQVTVAENGDVDVATLRGLLDTLAKDEPYLIDDGKAPKPKPDDAQGRPPVQPVSTATPGLGRLREAYATTPPKK